MRIGTFINSKLIPFLVALSGAKKGSWEAERNYTFLQSLIMIPVKRLRGIRRNEKFVEQQYDELSGLYIQDNYYKGRMRYSIVNCEVKEVSSIDNARMIRQEIRDVLNKYEFESVLEVGVGEITSLEDVYSAFGPNLECYGIDLSLNRLYHGLNEFGKRHDKLPTVAKANAIKLPFPDDAFDLVYTRHALEQMPEIYQSALDEIIRVSKKYIVLFEPSYELGSFAQKVKMLNSDYVRGIPRYLASKNNVEVGDVYLMKNSANPLNHTSCVQVKVKKNVSTLLTSSAVPFACPITKEPMELKAGYYYSSKASRAYPVVEGIPNFDPDYSVAITPLEGE